MKLQYGVVSGLTAAVIIVITGCGSQAAAVQNTATGSGQQQSSAGNFQPTLRFQTSPAKPKAGQKFTIDITFTRPAGARGANGSFGNGPGASGSGYGQGAFGNHTGFGNSTGGAPWANRTGFGNRTGFANGTGGAPWANRTGNTPWQGNPGGGSVNGTPPSGFSGRPSTGGFNGQAPNVNATLTGGSVNENVPLTFTGGHFTGTESLKNSGSYTLSVTMTLGSQTIQKQFTFKVQ